jgi:hypothetical protein
MHTARKLVLLGATLVAATSVLAAGLVTTTQPLTGQLMLKRGQATTSTRMEYCLRNMPELTDSLVSAHSNYSRAAAEAAAIVDRDYPASSFTFQRVRIQMPPQSTVDDLKRARSEGFNLLCPNLIAYMQRATDKSLAKEIGDILFNAQKLSEP